MFHKSMKTWWVVSYFFGGIIPNTWAMDHGGRWQWSQMLLAAFMFIVSRSCSSVGNFTCPTCIWCSVEYTEMEKTHSIVKMQKESKGGEIILVQHTSLLWFFVLLKSQPWVEQRRAGWVVGWLNVFCIHLRHLWQKARSSSIPRIFHFDFNKMLAWEPDFCIKSLSCRYHSPMSCENSGWSLSALWWILEKTPDLWQVRNCWKFGLQTCVMQSLESIQMS